MIEACTKEPTREGFLEEEVFTDKERFFFFFKKEKGRTVKKTVRAKVWRGEGACHVCLGNSEHSRCAAATGCPDKMQKQKIERQTGVSY